MAKRAAKTRVRAGAKAGKAGRRVTVRQVVRWVRRGALAAAALLVFLILLFAVVNPPRGAYMIAEGWREGGIVRDWVPIEEIAPVMARSAVAAEDANFCLHWGFDMAAIRQALDEGAGRGASTITQQVVKNVFLWHGRSWLRKALEAVITPAVELFWSKRRILEVYLNVAETGRGLFGVEAAAQAYFGVPAAGLSPAQAARIAAVLPDPKGRDPANPTRFLRNRAAAIASGADTIAADGRAACFED
jgi:monofunctional biosynthetic peptidoglycan transglycosylase